MNIWIMVLFLATCALYAWAAFGEQSPYLVVASFVVASAMLITMMILFLHVQDRTCQLKGGVYTTSGDCLRPDTVVR